MRPLAAVACVLAAVLAITAESYAQSSYTERPDSYVKRLEVRRFIREMAEQHGFNKGELTRLFARAERAEPVLQAIQPPPEKLPRSWEEYRATFLDERRIAGGMAFWNAHRAALERAQREYGVPGETIVAIVGVETFYGRNMGRWRVIDALTTLAFDYPPRADFFRGELAQYLLLAREAGWDASSLRGSYAGAIGIPQFMPSSARRYAVDFDGDGAIDLRNSAADAIGSVANFLKQHGWQPGAGVAFQARVTVEGYRAYIDGSVEPKHALADLLRAGVEPLEPTGPLEGTRAALIELETPDRPSDYRIGLYNFYVLTRYNRSTFYAAAVADLARALRAAQEPGR